MKTVFIAIHYLSLEYKNKVLQQGEFKLYKGKTREEAALGFWRQIQKESPRTLELVKITCDGEDITELVKNLLGS